MIQTQDGLSRVHLKKKVTIISDNTEDGNVVEKMLSILNCWKVYLVHSLFGYTSVRFCAHVDQLVADVGRHARLIAGYVINLVSKALKRAPLSLMKCAASLLIWAG